MIFFLQHDENNIRDYRNNATAAGCTPVVVLDSKDLKDYLTGQTDNCHQIDKSEVPVELNIIQNDTNRLKSINNKFVESLI